MNEQMLPNLNTLKDTLSHKREVLGIILSSNLTTSESFTPNIFIIVDKTESISAIKDIIELNYSNSFNYIIKANDDLSNMDGSILLDLFKSGKMIYWNGNSDISATQMFKLKPYSLFTFELSGIPHNQKVQFNYQLYGKKNSGQLSQWAGKRVAKSCFYVPHTHKFKVTRFLSKFNIKCENFDIWIWKYSEI